MKKKRERIAPSPVNNLELRDVSMSASRERLIDLNRSNPRSAKSRVSRVEDCVLEMDDVEPPDLIVQELLQWILSQTENEIYFKQLIRNQVLDSIPDMMPEYFIRSWIEQLINKMKFRARPRKHRSENYCLQSQDMCGRWICLILFNALLVFLICFVCGVLLVLFQPTSSTTRLTPTTAQYGQMCRSTPSCDTLRGLYCNKYVCTCYTNLIWNGTQCSCSTGYYYDGVQCLIRGYLQACNETMTCGLQFVCDSNTNSCVCPSDSTSYQTKFYTGTIYTSGTCQDKGGYNSDCRSYGTSSCQEWLGLSCEYLTDQGNVYACRCNSTSYFDQTLQTCQPLVYDASWPCYDSSSCASSLGLQCINNTCQCPSNYFWNNVTNTCNVKQSYQSLCYQDTWCDDSLGLVCNTAGYSCNCPTSSTAYKCDCLIQYYWDGQECTTRGQLMFPCAGDYSCNSSLTCQFGFCM